MNDKHDTTGDTTGETTEVLADGQISRGLASALRERGKALSDEYVGRMVADTEQTRADYQVKAILTGVALLAKKSALPHGQWTGYCRTLAQNGSTAAILTVGATHRSIRIYTQLARRFLSKLETGGFAAETVDASPCPVPVTAGEIADLAVSDEEALDPIFARLREFVGGRSIRRMLADFRQAEKDADPEEGDGAEQTPAAGQPAGARAGAQVDFWETFRADASEIIEGFRARIREAETLRRFEEEPERTAEELEALGQSLADEAKEIKKTAAQVREGITKGKK